MNPSQAEAVARLRLAVAESLPGIESGLPDRLEERRAWAEELAHNPSPIRIRALAAAFREVGVWFLAQLPAASIAALVAKELIDASDEVLRIFTG